MIILGIETSCDETSASLIEGKGDKIKVLSNIVSSQIELHKKYGGVVPEIAAREHVLNILPVINEAIFPLLAKEGGRGRLNVGSGKAKFKGTGLDAIAVATGPGLITSLITGIETAKALAYAWQKPLVAVNHIEGHIYSNFIEPGEKIKFPAVILTVSGGHTMLILMKGHGRFEAIGETRDDAAGEAFDKAAKLMNLGYPGGPMLSKEAAKLEIGNLKFEIGNYKSEIVNRKSQISLPRPMINSKNFDFSFSGLKTALLYQIQKDKNWKNRIPEYCSEFQQAIIDVLIAKTIKAAQKYNAKTILLSGGVSANSELRKQMSEVMKSKFPISNFQFPKLDYCTDNAAMVAAAGYFKALQKKYTPFDKIKVDSNLKL